MSNRHVSVTIIVLLMFLIWGSIACALEKNQPNTSIIEAGYSTSRSIEEGTAFQKARVLLNELSVKNRLLALELGKLPELQDGISSEDLSCLEKICDMYNSDPSSFDKTFEKMYSIGLRDVRRFNTPLQSVFWMLESGASKKIKDLVRSYSLNNMLDESWLKSGWKGKEWNDLDTITDRLNAPELLDYYIDHNFKKILMPDSKSHTFNDLIVRKEGWCGELAMLGRRILTRNGYNAEIYWDMAWPKTSFGERGLSGHSVAAYRNNDLMCVFIDFTEKGNFLHNCMDSKKWITGDESLFEDIRIRKDKMKYDTRYILRTEPLPGWQKER